jgi:hypothetical protein
MEAPVLFLYLDNFWDLINKRHAEQTRTDADSVLHHSIILGIERKAIFKDTADRDNFAERLGRSIQKSEPVAVRVTEERRVL